MLGVGGGSLGFTLQSLPDEGRGEETTAGFEDAVNLGKRLLQTSPAMESGSGVDAIHRRRLHRQSTDIAPVSFGQGRLFVRILWTGKDAV